MLLCEGLAFLLLLLFLPTLIVLTHALVECYETNRLLRERMSALEKNVEKICDNCQVAKLAVSVLEMLDEGEV